MRSVLQGLMSWGSTIRGVLSSPHVLLDLHACSALPIAEGLGVGYLSCGGCRQTDMTTLDLNSPRRRLVIVVGTRARGAGWSGGLRPEVYKHRGVRRAEVALPVDHRPILTSWVLDKYESDLVFCPC